MSAALDLGDRWAGPPPSTTTAAAVVKASPGRKSAFREPHPSRVAAFLPRVEVLLAFAARAGLKVAWVTFTSRAKAPHGAAGRHIVARDLDRAWGRFRNRAAWRSVKGALVVRADHGRRPHIHAILVLPQGLPLRAVRCAWDAGISHAVLVSGQADGTAIASYCAAQFRASVFKSPSRRRTFTYRAPPSEHLVSASTQCAPGPTTAPRRARTGGRSVSAMAFAATGQRASPSRWPQAGGERPEAVGAAAGPGADAGADCERPPRGSEPTSNVIVFNPNAVRRSTMPKHITPPLRNVSYDLVDILNGTNVVRSVMPRDRAAAVTVLGLVGSANLEQQLVEEVLMRLLYSDEVRRRRDGKVFVYWGTAKMPSLVSVPLSVPDRLRHFMVPPSFTSR